MSSPRVHPTAVVDASAVLADDVDVGPLSYVGPGVRLGAGTRLLASCVVLGPTTLGERNVVHPGAVLGGAPQDRTHRDEPTTLVVGDENVFREHVTVHRGTTKDRGETTLGSHGLFMASCHVAHDCVIEDHVTLANGTLLGGHVVVEAHAVTGGHVAIQPYVRIGSTAFLAGGAMVENDVPPFVVASGDRARVRALNLVGLRRRSVPEESIAALERTFRALFRSETPRALALAALHGPDVDDPWVARLLAFLRRGIGTPG
jgi:UDP-N-acetylglucosamine acyltransferase